MGFENFCSFINNDNVWFENFKYVLIFCSFCCGYCDKCSFFQNFVFVVEDFLFVIFKKFIVRYFEVFNV